MSKTLCKALYFAAHRRSLVMLVFMALLSITHAQIVPSTAWHTGDGPYTINTAEDLAGLAELVNGGNNFQGKTIKLSANIVLNETGDGWNSLVNESEGFTPWIPIGTYSPERPFRGTFDGNGYVVKGIYISNTSNQQGLFGFLGSGGTIKNLGITASYVKGQNMVGGLVGRNTGTVSNSYAANGMVVNGNDDVGGLVGGNYSGTISNCYAVAKTQIKNYYGVLAGYNSGGTISNSYYDKDYLNTTFGVGTAKTTLEMQSQTFADDLNFTAGLSSVNKWNYNAGNNYPTLLHDVLAPDPTAGAFANGDGTEASPYIIQTVAELKTLSSFTNAGLNFQGKFFKLAADIVLNDITNWENWSASVAPANSWTPIKSFKGTFDGNGYVIKGVYINGTGSQSLFLTLEDGGTIKNLGITASFISGGEDTGGLVGVNFGKIINSYSVGTKVTSGSSNDVGGLVGEQKSTGSINNCYSASIVTGGGSYGGGLVGGSSLTGTIQNSYYDEISTKTDSKGTRKTTASMKTQQFADDLNNVAGGFKGNKWNYTDGNYPVLLPNVIAPDPATIAFESGSGTVGDPFIIKTKVQLEAFRFLANGGRNFDGEFIKLGANIELNSTTNWETWNDATEGLSVWTPITPTEAIAFKGTFDGNGFTISGVYISSTNSYQGLFGYFAGTLKNLGVTKSYIKGGTYTGGFIGRANGNATNVVLIENSHFNGKVTVSSSSTSGGAGGLVGWAFGVSGTAGASPTIIIRDSYSTGSVTVIGSSATNAGGLVGHFQNRVLIDNCYSTATVTGIDEVGGLTGSNYNGSSVITNSYFSGTVTGRKTVGGITGINYGVVSNSYSTGKVSGTEQVGGLVGASTSAEISNSYSASDVSGTAFVGGIVGQFGGTNGKINSSYSISTLSGALSGTAGGLVGGKMASTYNNCAVVSSYYNTDITSRNDPELGEGKNTAWMKSSDIITELNAVATLLSLKLWSLPNGGYPILGEDAGALDIASHFDGGNGTSGDPYQIRTPQQLINLSTLVDAEYDFDGFHFKLTADIALNDTDGWENWTAANGPENVWKPIGYYAGGGVAFKGTFDGNGKTVSGVYIKAGGYMGFFGYTGTNAKVKNLGIIKSYIGATDIYAGGLVAMNSGEISNCYFEGKVVSAYQPQFSNVAYTGALVGQNSGIYALISNSYAIGLVSGRGGIGGLVGVNRGNARIEKSYALVSVIAQTPDNVNGLVGNLENGTVTNSYYDKTINETLTDSRGEGRTPIELKKMATFETWDFAAVWGRRDDKNNGYPYLRWGTSLANDTDSEETDPDIADGIEWYNDEDTEFTLSTAQELAELARLVNAERDDFANKTILLGANINLADLDANWLPIGNSVANPFKGIFNGQGKTVSGLSISGGEYVGLFGYVKDGQTKNITIIASEVKTSQSGKTYAGILAGVYDSDKTIENVLVSGNAVGAGGMSSAGSDACNVGGLVGETRKDNLTITNSRVIGAVSGPANSGTHIKLGGLVGYAHGENLTIEKSFAEVTVSGYSETIGGFIGNAYGTTTIKNSYASGIVRSYGSGAFVGGLIGIADDDVEVKNSYVNGTVAGGYGSTVGAIIGYGDAIASSVYYNTSANSDIEGTLKVDAAQLKTQSTFAGWDFVDIWGIDLKKNNSYPYLKGFDYEEDPIQTFVLPQIAAGNIHAYAINKTIMLENLPKNAKVQVYDLKGKQVYFSNSGNSQILRIPVQTKGIYFVKAGNQILRVSVK